MSLDTPLAIVIAFVVILLLGMAIGFTMGLAKGVLLGARFHTGRPVSPIPWILSAIGSGICLLVAIGTSIYSVYFLTGSLTAEATITGILERRDEDGNSSQVPVYSYSLPDGRSFTDQSSINDGREYQVGDRIPIRYLKAAPHRSRIDFFAHHWFPPILMAIFSMALAALAVGLRWWREKEQQLANQRLASNGFTGSS